jgi:hypothetical protein
MNKYIKTTKKIERGHKQTGVNIEFYQYKIIKDQNLNLSLLLRDFLDDYLAKNFPIEFKKSQLLESETLKDRVKAYLSSTGQSVVDTDLVIGHLVAFKPENLNWAESLGPESLEEHIENALNIIDLNNEKD